MDRQERGNPEENPRKSAPGADLYEANLPGEDLRGADLHGADLARADLHGANLEDADLSAAHLAGADLVEADLAGARLDGADLNGAVLTGANLQQAKLAQADLHGADLTDANLEDADLRNADLHETDLKGADVRGADLRGARLPNGHGSPAASSAAQTMKATESAIDPGKTVLIVEDDNTTRELLGLLLARAGYQVEQAGDGCEALEVLERERRPDLILLDMMMPRLDGWGFLEKRAADTMLEPIPVVISTAVAEADRSWAASLGANGLIRKPFDVPTLLSEIAHYCN